MRRTLSFLVGQTSSTYFSTRLHRSTPAAQLPHCLFNNDHQIRHTNWSQLFVDSFPIHGYNTCAKDVGKGISDTGSAAGSETADQTHRTSSASRHGDQSKCCAVGTISERVQAGTEVRPASPSSVTNLSLSGDTLRPLLNTISAIGETPYGWYKLVKGKNYCRDPDCTKRASFDFEGAAWARYCASHKHAGMVDVVSRRCEEEGCAKSPRYNTEGVARGRFCRSHRQLGMVDVKSPRCELDGCSVFASCNWPGASKRRFCAAHKEVGMVDVTNLPCKNLGCTTRPCFNTPGLPPRYCAAHKGAGMVDVRNKSCEIETCSKHPRFNFEGAKWGRFCSPHKQPGMINVFTKVHKE